jgi:hypothetical protein
VEYLDSLGLTAAMPLERLLSGHGAVITGHADLVERRFGEHQRRCERILAVLQGGPANAYEITRHLWSARTVAEQPLLVIWEVLGHLDLLLEAGVISERVTDDGSRYGVATFASRDRLAPDEAGTGRPARTGAGAVVRGFRFRDPRNHKLAGGRRLARANGSSQPASH